MQKVLQCRIHLGTSGLRKNKDSKLRVSHCGAVIRELHQVPPSGGGNVAAVLAAVR
ncbi:MAG TPA: hypothetical protein VF824_12870 [Thermoanaerobaculia bacterium]|jgi:hypothetical protein